MAKAKKNTEEDFEKEIPENKVREPWWQFVFDPRFHKTVGFLFLMFSVYLTIAFVSFLFTWKTDQSVVMGGGWSSFLSANPDAAQNWLGVSGAMVAHVFIHQWFGLASFAFVLIFFLIGFRILFKMFLLPFGKTLKYSFFSVIWLSLVLGFVFSGTSDLSILGGAFGYHGTLYLKALLGSAGTLLFFIGYATVFSILVWNIEFYRPRPAPQEPILAGPAPETAEEHDYYTHKDDIEHPEHESESMTSAPEDALSEEEATDFTIIYPPQQEGNEQSEIADEPEVVLDFPTQESKTKQEVPHTAPVNDLTLEIEEELVEVNEGVVPEHAPPVLGSLGTEYDPTLEYPGFRMPPLELLKEADENRKKVSMEELEENKKLIVDTLKNYAIGIDKIKATIGPTVTLYEIVPVAGVRISRIKNLEDDIALSLAAPGIRIIAPIPGKGTIGIEVPNQNPEMVGMRSVLASPRFQSFDGELPVCFGKTISNEVYVADLAKMPHLLMAGATGQGKSVGINVILTSLLYKKHPSQLKLILVDPKKVELSLYRTIERHYLAKIPGDLEPIITDTKLVVNTLNSLCILMDARYDLLKEAGVRNIKEYNVKFLARQLNPQKGHHFMPYIVVVIDELADLMMTAGKDVEFPIGRLAQLARAIGIHLILATQRPSVNVITGTIKANFPARAAFKVSSKIDSRTILDGNGADQLIGKGDMLISNGSDLVRVQCAFVDTPEVEKVAEFIGNQRGTEPYRLPEVKDESGEPGFDIEESGDRDLLFVEAAKIVVQHQQGSTSLLQRRLKLGYNRAGRLIDQLEKAGIVGPFTGSKARDVLVPDDFHLEQLLKDIGL